MRIGVLTAGGDAPGLNAAIRAIAQLATRDGHDVIGIANGWAGLADEYAGRLLETSDFGGILNQGGTLLGTARYNLDDPAGGRERVLHAMDEHLDALIAIGGDGTQRISNWLAEHGAEHKPEPERSPDQPEAKRQPARQRQRPRQALRPRRRHHQRRQRQHAGAEDRQQPREEGQRERRHFAAFKTSSTLAVVMPHDMRLTSLPPL